MFTCPSECPVFYRSYDGVTPGYETKIFDAVVNDFNLDKFEVTVGRFRKFVDAWLGGWRPVFGSGKHTHLNGGAGLHKFTNGFELGWDTNWQNYFVNVIGTQMVTKADWDADMIRCPDPQFRTWTSNPGNNENRPINCVNWFQAHAFCIWDEGFLPTETEWNYAAAGGTEQRIYPWGNNSPPANASYAIYGSYYTESGVPIYAPVGSAQLGNGKYGQSDLAGNVREWTSDWYFYPPPSFTQRYFVASNMCNTGGAMKFNNCSHLDQIDNRLSPPYNVSALRIIRGAGSESSTVFSLPVSIRFGLDHLSKGVDIGFRCARTPQ
jgi:formylglycine-generating enzyme required for sulfatase activity